MTVKNNRSTPFMERPPPLAGNNKNTRNIVRIKKLLSSEGPKSYHQIRDHLNTWRHGVTNGSLSNILGKGPFIQVGFEGGVGIYDNLDND